MGLFIPPTVVDAGFYGTLTIEIRGGTFPVKAYSGDRFMHLVISDEISYSSKVYRGKYAGEISVTPGISDKVRKNGNV
jgi:dCTP deaminase